MMKKNDAILYMSFKDRLIEFGIDPYEYLRMIEKNVKLYYNGNLNIEFAKDKKHKIKIMNPDTKKWVSFGGYDNGDFLMYKIMEKLKQVEKGTADKKQLAYLARAMNIKGKWRDDPYSKNNLAIYLLWM